MEGTESTTRERTTGNGGNQAAVNMELMSGKPLHRFVRNEPRSLGVTHLTIQSHSNDSHMIYDVHKSSSKLSAVGVVIHPSSSPSQIVMLVFGCAELLMGFPLAKQGVRTSWAIYIPLWQGALVRNI